MAQPLFSLVHPTCRLAPSAAFPLAWREAHDTWIARADHPERIEYVLAVHASRWDEFIGGPGSTAGGWPADRGGETFTAVRNENRDCVVDQTNAAVRAATGRIIIGVQDDFFPPEHWDTLILEAMTGRQYPAEEFTGEDAALDRETLVQFSTGAPADRERELMIGCAVTPQVFERRGYALDPDFESMFSDNWWAFENRRDESAGLLAIIERLDIVFEHRHPVFGAPGDEWYARENRPEAYRAGEVIFHQKVNGSKVLTFCLPGENFRSELISGRYKLIDDIRGRSAFQTVPLYWCHTTNVYATRIELAKGALEFPSCTKAQDLILTADDDNPLEYGQLEMLMQDLEDNPELAGVLAWCWCDHNETEDPNAQSWVMSCGRQDPKTLRAHRFTADDFDRAIEKGHFLISSDDVAPEWFWSGLPVLLIRRSAMEKMGWRAFVARTADPILMGALELARLALSDLPDVRRVLESAQAWGRTLDATQNGMTSEDTSFFIRANELGLKFAVDIRVRVQHVKWRGIQPQYIPESERAQVERQRAGARL